MSASRNTDSKFEFEPRNCAQQGPPARQFSARAPSNRDAEGWDGARAPRDHQSKTKALRDRNFVEPKAFV